MSISSVSQTEFAPLSRVGNGRVSSTPTTTPSDEPHAAAIERDEPTLPPANSDKELVEVFVGQVEQEPAMAERGLSFRVDDVTGKLIVSVVDKESGEVVRQIPPEELIDFARTLSEGTGVLLNKKA